MFISFEGIDGSGKCLGRGTPILMYDGSVQPVEEVRGRDLLMGPDSRPRRVRSLVRGRAPLYRVVPRKGDPYVINESHVLSLRMCRTIAGYTKGAIVNIPAREYLATSLAFKQHALGWRVGVEFPSRPVSLDPYTLGVWLGDGHTSQPRVTTGDAEVVEALGRYAESSAGVSLTREIPRTGCVTNGLRGAKAGIKGANPLINALKDYGIYGEKRIPRAYKVNDRQTRLEVLAGLIDTDGHLQGGCYEIRQKSEALADDILFLARSLGLAAYKTATPRSAANGTPGNRRTYYRVSISGDLSNVPVRLGRKRALARRQVKDVLRTGIRLEPLGEGDYFGFELDGDRLFLLGDFTVTHNSTQARLLEAHLRRAGRAVLLVREPGGTPLAERVRALLLGHEVAVSPFAELLLFSAARAQLVEEALRPALAAGTVVLADRFFDSTTAYQGGGRGLADADWLSDFHRHVTGGLVPERTFLLDVPPEVAARRRAGRDDGPDRMEAGGEAFFARVRAAYLALAAREPARVRVLDGTLPPDWLHEQVVRDVERRLAEKGRVGEREIG